MPARQVLCLTLNLPLAANAINLLSYLRRSLSRVVWSVPAVKTRSLQWPQCFFVVKRYGIRTVRPTKRTQHPYIRVISLGWTIFLVLRSKHKNSRIRTVILVNKYESVTFSNFLHLPQQYRLSQMKQKSVNTFCNARALCNFVFIRMQSRL